MGVYTKESLELLKTKIDLIELISSYVPLKAVGAVHKGLCPFHDEKTPSFTVQRGDAHYHCFGCGAHGDAIAFLMSYMKMSFVEAIDTLALRFQVAMEQIAYEKERISPNKKELKEALLVALQFYHTCLLHTDGGHIALDYLYKRGIDLNFIRLFQIGFAPKESALFTDFMEKSGFSTALLEEAGLIKNVADGKKRAFFISRITFPILDSSGAVIGFSARKIDEESFGPKYINSPETPLFKKSRTLYGLSFSRRRIAKEKRAMIVEGQIDALRLIQEGFNITVAGQGTAFTEEHSQELIRLGAEKIYLALDGDAAGIEAAAKIGNLFQKEGVEVYVLSLPHGMDPDTLLQEEGPHFFIERLEKADDYLTFLVSHLSKGMDPSSPSQKNQLIQTIAERVRNWDHPLMVHESLRKLARLTQVPENLVGVGQETLSRSTYVKRVGALGDISIDPQRVLEIDLLRWLFLLGETNTSLLDLARQNIVPKHFTISVCRHLFSLYMEEIDQKKSIDLLSLANELQSPEEQLLLSENEEK